MTALPVMPMLTDDDVEAAALNLLLGDPELDRAVRERIADRLGIRAAFDKAVDDTPPQTFNSSLKIDLIADYHR